jgi:hypothetical protein
MMLLAKALQRILQRWEQGMFPNLHADLIQGLNPILFQMLESTVNLQAQDGTWGQIAPVEETAYAMILLKTLVGTPSARPLEVPIKRAIGRGEVFLRRQKLDRLPLQYLWISKLSYGISYLTRAYVIAALSPFKG